MWPLTVRGTSRSICTSSGDATACRRRNSAMRYSSVSGLLWALALVTRNEYHAAERLQSGMPFQVRSICLG
jgi:hypothetical protein